MAQPIIYRLLIAPTETIRPSRLQAPHELTQGKITARLIKYVLGAAGIGAIISAVIALKDRSKTKAYLSATLVTLIYVIANYAPRLLNTKARTPAITIDNFKSLIDHKFLTEKECTSILQVCTSYKKGLIEQAVGENKCIRMNAKATNAARTLLITPEGKLFVILNQTKAKDTRIVGKGAQTVVKYCFELTEKKWCTHASFTDKQAWEKATALLNRLKGKPNILQLLATDEYASKNDEVKIKYSMITEYCEHGDLVAAFTILPIQDHEKKEFCKKIAIALREVHLQGYAHNDLKPDNIFVKKEEGKSIPILADFEGVYELTDANQKQLCGGTPAYLHPIIAKARTTQAQESLPSLESRDIWSLGVLFYEIQMQSNQVLPWVMNIDKNLSIGEQRKKILSNLAALADGNTPAFNEPVDKTSLEYLIWNMLQVDPAKQFNLDQVIQFFI